MSTPAKRKAESPEVESPASTMAKTKTPTPNPASPAHKSPTPASPAYKFPTPGSPPAAGEPSEPNGLGMPESDLDSTLGSDDESSTASIASSILRYRTINGRTYHSDSVTDGEYCLPNDTKHLEALAIFTHAMDLMLGGKLHAVNIGTASGLWAIDFADDLALSNLLVDIQIRFFDYIHVRFMTGAINDWDHLYEQAYKVCKPGVWFEHGSALDQYGKMFEEAGRRLVMSQTVADNNLQETGLKKAGFVNLTDPKMEEIGLYTYARIKGDLEGIIQVVARNVMGWSQEEMAAYLAHLRQGLRDKNIHAYWRWKIVYAQKPLE
ncbi:hypothetical protein QBC45DRAFT_451449 [Copromyces sp. CBS 386.78]|nr:hypothetical protein QBC45DRAFT_451449 [Copromyces sp. CBS 386.78]